MTASIARRFGVDARVLPATDDRVQTRIECVDQVTGEPLDLHFQEYWVRRAARDPVKGVRYDGALDAVPAPGVLASIADADLIVICPSNPVVSIGPILAIPGVRDAVTARMSAAASTGLRVSATHCKHRERPKRQRLPSSERVSGASVPEVPASDHTI